VADGASTTIASLALSIDESFGYWFDFGDDRGIRLVWWRFSKRRRSQTRRKRRMGSVPESQSELGRVHRSVNRH
jgi:hypothetical protein